ncbi:hypothetical protein Z517_08720 [Fonsecaea pedrosoi CBS 271.37]|uniref:Uncharacterized protein n=1 Tax=Fonsecaea pedrosoi CBS 271.37 TaxID=1442368 RepID=A0A0D2DMG3_9EURO|nr:uncharacterized protein Z517_08720 [Fonsecaea pedrosoi CBS 271.37]KIW78881.1 hypothetical protein Z517_08720 [Fonsecaea pedrosoi CBS 271.37]
MGHTSKKMGEKYNKDEDSPLNVYKATNKETRIDNRLIQAQSPFPKPNHQEMRKIIDDAIVAHADDIQRTTSRDISFFLGETPGRDCDGYHEYHQVRGTYRRTALMEMYYEGAAEEAGSSDDRPSSKRQRFDDGIALLPTISSNQDRQPSHQSSNVLPPSRIQA